MFEIYKLKTLPWNEAYYILYPQRNFWSNMMERMREENYVLSGIENVPTKSNIIVRGVDNVIFVSPFIIMLYSLKTIYTRISNLLLLQCE